MELQLRQASKKKARGKISVSDHIFGSEYKEALVHQAVVAFMAAGRAGTRAQKTRSEVHGSGRKPWRQKGTGRARVGNARNPIWRGGGVTFAAKPKDFSQKLNKKMYRGAMRSIFAEMVRQERLVIVDKLPVKSPKTKDMLALLKLLGLHDVLIVSTEITDNLILSTRNIQHVDFIDVREVNPYILIRYENLLITKSALVKIEELLA